MTTRAELSDALAILDITAPVSLAELRKRYLRKLREFPPQSDPDGFRRVRQAFDTLSAPGTLDVALRTLNATPEILLERLEARFAAELDGSRAETDSHQEEARLRKRWRALVRDTDWRDLVQRFTSTSR